MKIKSIERSIANFKTNIQNIPPLDYWEIKKKREFSKKTFYHYLPYFSTNIPWLKSALVGSNHFSIQMAAFNLFSVTKSSNNKSRDVVLPFRLCPSLLLYGALYWWLPGVWLLNKLIQPIIKVRLMEDFCPNNSPASFFTTLAVLLLL